MQGDGTKTYANIVMFDMFTKFEFNIISRLCVNFRPCLLDHFHRKKACAKVLVYVKGLNI